MATLTKSELKKRVEATPIAKPDEWDLQFIKEIDEENDISEGVSLDELRTKHKCSGRIAVRVPKTLHFELLKQAKENGVSLNQFIVYKLAKG